MRAIVIWGTLLLAGGAARPDDGLRLPRSSSSTATDGDRAVAAWPFGRVEVRAADVAPPGDAPRPAGRVRAQNRGVFRLTYQLTREGDAVTAQRVRVTAENTPEFLDAPTARLEEHEDGHRRINEREARRIEKTLATFRSPGPSTARAEARLKALFRREVEAARRLNAAWDDTHVFPSTAPYK